MDHSQISEELLKRNDTVLASVLNDIFDGVYIVDKDRRILFWNKRAEEITGFSSQEVKGRYCHEAILSHIDSNGNPLCNGNCPLVRTLDTGERIEEKVYPCHKSGKRFPTLTHVAPIQNENGEIIAAIEVFRDISGEEEFRILQEKFNKLIAKYVSSSTLDDVMAKLNGAEGARSNVRDLTILYLDVVGFTIFSEQHTAEEAVVLLNEVFGICEVITTEFHGDIDKFIGDCIMAVFIDANDAVNAAKQILRALQNLNKQRCSRGETPVAVRIGINSGLVIQGDVGMQERKDLTVIGDVVNTSARIQPIADPNSICISEATLVRLDDTENFDCIGSVNLKNKAEPTTLYKYVESG